MPTAPISGSDLYYEVHGSRYVAVTGAGHSVYCENAGEFNRLVAEFIQEVGA